MAGSTLEVRIEDAATPALRGLTRAFSRRDIRAAAGGAVRRELRNHFRRLDVEKPNKLGGARTNFYGRAVQAVQMPEITPEGVRVAIAHQGLRQRYYGGTIVARSSKYLTIPVHPLAHGKRAREFADLVLVKSRAGQAMLVRKGADEEKGEVFYLLKKRVTQKADPSVLPKVEVLSRAALAAAEDHAAVIIARRAQTKGQA
jgi:hypothetical protein